MNRSFEIERARADVAARKARCGELFDVSTWYPMHSIFGCWNYHQAVNELRESEQRLARLEAAP